MNKKNQLRKGLLKKPAVKVQDTTTAALTAVLQGIKGAKIATIITETDANLKKTGNPFRESKVIKRTTMNVMMNFNYRAALDKALVAKGEAPSNRPPGKRAWGERVPNSPFIMHEGALYFEAKLNGKASSVEYLLEGQPLAAAEVAPFIPKRQEMEVPMVDVKIQNIKELRVNGTRYVVK